MQIFVNFNIDLVFIGGTSNINYKKDIYDRYATIFPSFETFCNILEECSRDNGYLVIHMSSRSIKLEEMIFYYNYQENPILTGYLFSTKLYLQCQFHFNQVLSLILLNI